MSEVRGLVTEKVEQVNKYLLLHKLKAFVFRKEKISVSFKISIKTI